MIEAGEKSTAAPPPLRPPAVAEVAPDLWLDHRLALMHRREGWLAVADVHYGYEISRRAAGGLFPLWGMDTIEARFAALLSDHRPETVIVAGDVVDGGLASREACDWLESIRDRCGRLVLVAGNHDRGGIRRRFDFVDSHLTAGGAFFHHGHQSPPPPPGAAAEFSGHRHPSVSISDGAGLRLRLPCLVHRRPRRPAEGRAAPEQWILPAFSPWAGGGPWSPGGGGSPDDFRQWVCGGGRVFEWAP